MSASASGFSRALSISALLHIREARGTGPRLAGVTSSSLWVGSPDTVERRGPTFRS